MPTTEKVVSMLVWGEGFSEAQVAEILDMPSSTVRGALKRARDRLIALGVPAQLSFEAKYGLPERGNDS